MRFSFPLPVLQCREEGIHSALDYAASTHAEGLCGNRGRAEGLRTDVKWRNSRIGRGSWHEDKVDSVQH